MEMSEPLSQFADAFKGAFERFCAATDLHKTFACFSQEVQTVCDARSFETSLLNLISDIFQSTACAQDDIPQDAVLINQPSSVLLDRIQNFINWKRDQINRSNLKEFFDPKEPEACARLALRKMNRTTQIKTAVVENWEGPLDKSILPANEGSKDASSQSFPKNIASHLQNKSLSTATLLNIDPTVEERINLVEDHMRLPSVIKSLPLLQRIKACEEKLVSIETNYPFLAFYHFHHCKQFPSIKSFEKDNVPVSSKRRIDNSTVVSANTPPVATAFHVPHQQSSGEVTGNSSGTTSPNSAIPHSSSEEVYEKLLEAKRKLL